MDTTLEGIYEVFMARLDKGGPVSKEKGEVKKAMELLIEKHRLSYEMIAVKVGTSARSVYRWQSGKTKPIRSYREKLLELLKAVERADYTSPDESTKNLQFAFAERMDKGNDDDSKVSHEALQIQLFKTGEKKPEMLVTIPLKNPRLAKILLSQMILLTLEREGIDFNEILSVVDKERVAEKILDIDKEGERIVITVG